MYTKMRCYVFDIDGTLADVTHRLPCIQKDPKDWDAFFDACSEDKPIQYMVDLAWALAEESHIVFVTGRPQRSRKKTEAWLLDRLGFLGRPLYMRKDGDHRPDGDVKSELLDQLVADGYEPALVFEDRSQVVRMWRDRGIPCAQVADGDF
jgi:phosphoglycolate phosphatase-like HAD superfamily hydrolase